MPTGLVGLAYRIEKMKALMIYRINRLTAKVRRRGKPITPAQEQNQEQKGVVLWRNPNDKQALQSGEPSDGGGGDGGGEGGQWVRTLDMEVAQLEWLAMLKKNDLVPGSIVEIQTANSVYELLVLDKEEFIVSGGWFDQQDLSPYRVGINGCTWGGSALKWDIIAGAMMHIEFSVGGRMIVTTSPIQGWKVYGGLSARETLPG